MTFADRVDAVAAHGFTPRQAGFLVTVMEHAGVCLGRHYCTYARIAYGQKMHDFFRLLVEGRYASANTCGHNRARVYHLHAKPLYRAIGEPNNRHRLMVLDAVLSDRTLRWLGTESDKVAHFSLQHQVRREDLPAVTFRGPDSVTIRHFPDKLPIGISVDARLHVFLYLATRPTAIDFRAFLERHAELLRGLPAWTVSRTRAFGIVP